LLDPHIRIIFDAGLDHPDSLFDCKEWIFMKVVSNSNADQLKN
jgi:hypothetical protein